MTVDTVVDSVGGSRLVRFDRAERWLHATTGVLVLVLMATGALLYFDFLSGLVGRRALLKDIHVVSGLALLVPLAVTLAGRWRAGCRADAARLGRWTSVDSLWVRTRGRSPALRLGKFNAGQKIYALVMAGVLPVLLMTGSIMKWFGPFPDSMRTGATFVHDISAWVVWFGVGVHILKALAEPELLRAMTTGTVSRAWASVHRPRWHDAVLGLDSVGESTGDLAEDTAGDDGEAVASRLTGSGPVLPG